MVTDEFKESLPRKVEGRLGRDLLVAAGIMEVFGPVRGGTATDEEETGCT